MEAAEELTTVFQIRDEFRVTILEYMNALLMTEEEMAECIMTELMPSLLGLA